MTTPVFSIGFFHPVTGLYIYELRYGPIVLDGGVCYHRPGAGERVIGIYSPGFNLEYIKFGPMWWRFFSTGFSTKRREWNITTRLDSKIINASSRLSEAKINSKTPEPPLES